MKVIASVFLILFVSVPAICKTPVPEDRRISYEFNVSTSATLSLENYRGNITIESWDKPVISISGVLDSESKFYSVEAQQYVVKFLLNKHRLSKNGTGSELLVRVPESVTLNIKDVKSNIYVKDLKSGGVIRTEGGRVVLSNSVGDFRFNTVNTELELEKHKGKIIIDSISSNVEGQLEGELLRVNSVSGNYRFRDSRIDVIEYNTISGDIFLAVALSRNSDFTFNTITGDVEVSTRKPLNVEIEMRSHSVAMKSIISGHSSTEKIISGATRVKKTFGSGDARIYFNSVSGRGTFTVI